MSCYEPLNAWRAYGQRTETGKAAIVFSRPAGPAEAIKVPCGRCIGCRMDKSRDWALRCVHEAQLHDANCFATLTYAEGNVPEGGTLVKTDHQKFMKRLRKEYPARRIRYFMCGEYGSNNERPHYHFLLFGLDFVDKVVWSTSGDHTIWRSPTLEKLWPNGYAFLGDVTWESAAYVARYCLKKATGHDAYERYVKDLDPDTGEVVMLEPEYIAMSRRPGIGKKWFDRFKDDCRKDFLTHNGKLYKLPAYYGALMEIEDPVRAAENKARRKEKATAKQETRKRLGVLKVAHEKQVERLTRSI